MYFVFISAFIYAFVFVIGGDHVSILKHIHVCIKWKRRDEQLTLQLEASQKELNKTVVFVFLFVFVLSFSRCCCL